MSGAQSPQFSSRVEHCQLRPDSTRERIAQHPSEVYRSLMRCVATNGGTAERALNDHQNKFVPHISGNWNQQKEDAWDYHSQALVHRTVPRPHSQPGVKSPEIPENPNR